MERARGFTLIEAVIAMAVLAVGLVLAGSLLVQAYRMLAQAGIDARTPTTDLALERLKVELQAASDVSSGVTSDPTWTPDRLELVYPDGRRVRYEQRGSALLRQALAVDAEAWGPSRQVVSDVLSWRWQRLGSRLVAVEIVYRARPGSATVIDPVGPIDDRQSSRRPTTRTLTTAMRGGGLGWGW